MTSRVERTAAHTPYQELLGDAYDGLHPHVRAAHEPLTAEGRVDVVHGTHVLTPLVVRIMNLPAPGDSRAVTLRVTIDDSPTATSGVTMTWMRQIGETRLDTRQFARHGHLVEEAGPGSVKFRLRVDDDGSLVYESARCRFLRVPVPRLLSPQVRASVGPVSSGWRVDVVVEWRGHLICSYGGLMQPVRTAA